MQPKPQKLSKAQAALQQIGIKPKVDEIQSSDSGFELEDSDGGVTAGELIDVVFSTILLRLEDIEQRLKDLEIGAKRVGS